MREIKFRAKGIYDDKWGLMMKTLETQKMLIPIRNYTNKPEIASL